MNRSFSNTIPLIFRKAGWNSNFGLNFLRRFKLSEAPKGGEVLFPKSTPFANLPQRSSILIVVLMAVTIIYGLLYYHPIPYSGNKAGEDLRCYRRIIERIHAGESYYEAATSELRTRGYPTSSVFNWRLPTLAWFMGQLPTLQTGWILAILLAFTSLLIWISVLIRGRSFSQVFFGTFLLLGSLIYSLLPEVPLTHEFWAGTLITFSLGAYSKGWRIASLVSALLALFLRELTLPFVGLMMVATYFEGRRREALLWLLGIIAFGLMLAYHGTVVKGLIKEGDFVQEKGWLAFSGWLFILSTAQMHPFLLLMPPWVPAILLPLILLGFAAWRGPVGSRIAWTVGLYIASYSLVGKPFNHLWGMMYVNIMLLGLLYVPSSLSDLLVSACGRHTKRCV
jgi:hypothetical protein